MVKLFKTINLEDTEKQINKFQEENPEWEITSISHSDVGTAKRIGIAQWMTLVGFKNRR